MNKQEVIEYFGSMSAIAKELGISSASISRWTKVPHWHQKAIEAISHGKLKAEPKPQVIHETHPNTRRLIVSNIPIDTIELFKELCRKQNVFMSTKINELIEQEINNPH